MFIGKLCWLCGDDIYISMASLWHIMPDISNDYYDHFYMAIYYNNPKSYMIIMVIYIIIRLLYVIIIIIPGYLKSGLRWPGAQDLLFASSINPKGWRMARCQNWFLMNMSVERFFFPNFRILLVRSNWRIHVCASNRLEMRLIVRLSWFRIPIKYLIYHDISWYHVISCDIMWYHVISCDI